MTPKNIPAIECSHCHAFNLVPFVETVMCFKDEKIYRIRFWYCPPQSGGCGTVYYFPEHDKILEKTC